MRKSQIKELYDKFLGEKCSMTVYYQRIKKGVNPIEALKPVERKDIAVRSQKFKEELERYKKQPQPKPPRPKFYGRLIKGYSKEEAIKIQLIKKERKTGYGKRNIYIKAYTVREQNEKPDYREIKITYKDDESTVFKSVYEDMIHELEDKRYMTDDVIEAKEIKEKIEQLKKEYQTFISYNNKNELL